MLKKTFAAACGFALLACNSHAQGLLLMSNANPINDNRGNPAGSASGTELTVELVEGTTSLSFIPSSINNVNQGYFYGPGSTGILTISGAAPGTTVYYAVVAWSSAAGSYLNAQRGPGFVFGQSVVCTYTLAGGSTDISPAPLNFPSFSVGGLFLSQPPPPLVIPPGVPEPSTLALGFVGVTLIFLRRRVWVRDCESGKPIPAG